MRKFIYFVGCLVISFVLSSCINQYDSEKELEKNDVKTVTVTLTSPHGNATYSFIDEEGEVYKSGVVYSGGLVLKKFKVGYYQLQYHIYNTPYHNTSGCTITKNCTVSFGYMYATTN